MSESCEFRIKREMTREAIIGLGEASFRKSYYTELQEKIAVLERNSSRNRALLATIPDMLLVSDFQGQITLYSAQDGQPDPMALELLGDSEIVGQLQEAIKEVIIRRERVTHNFVITANDRVYYYEARLQITESDEVLIMIRDMTERTMLEMKLLEMVEIDSLTHLYNRRYFEDRLAEFEGKLIRNFSIILIDINGLKMINDTLGHLAGDEIIINIAQLIDRHFGRIGYVARVGGDEFGIILHGYNPREIEFKLEQLRQSIQEYNIRSEALKASISSGYSCVENRPVNTRWLFQEADNYMYQNKLMKEASVHSSLFKTLMKALEAKDYITEGHARRMESLAIRMGESLRLPQSQLDRIKLLTSFHDIGKVGIPDSILSKPSPLTEDEWIIMRSHASIGKRIAECSPELEDISRLILMHHEKWDGTGYPLGIKGLDIPIECRILSIVDAFDAMTNDRPYRKALSSEEALAKIEAGAGSQFDRSLVDLFLRIMNHS